MAKIKIVTDSTADIPLDVRTSLGISMVPLKVHFGKDTYRDGVSIHAEQFYDLLMKSDSLPTTSQPSPVDFLELYKQLTEDSQTQVISIHLSSALSGTYQAAILAKSLLQNKADITIIDSKTASSGIGLLVIAAALAAKEGNTKEHIIALIHKLREQTELYFLVDTLDYLQKGGRIGKASAYIGSLLNIKPILSIDESGEVYSVDKVRGKVKAMHRMMELIKQKIQSAQGIHVIIAHSHALETAEQFAAMLQDNFKVSSLSYTSIGPVIGTHAGPGAIGVFVRPV